MNDHGVTFHGNHLKNKIIAFVVTGGIAAYKAPSIIRALRGYGATVVPFMTEAAQSFITAKTIAWAANHTVVTELSYKSEHLFYNNGKPYDAVLVAPCTLNFMNKVVSGIADDAASTLLAAHRQDFCQSSPNFPFIYFCPTMHSIMALNNQFTTTAMKLENDRCYVDWFGVDNIINNDDDKIHLTKTKTLVSQFIHCFNVAKEKPLANKKILVTTGPTPTKIDSVRILTNKFSGKLGILIANDLYLQGANVYLLQSKTGIRPPKHITHDLFEDYDDYKKIVMDHVDWPDYAIFSAAVADYTPITYSDVKIPSKSNLTEIKLKETEKVVNLFIKDKKPECKVISFKYEDDPKHHREYLEDVAKKRLKQGHWIVIGNNPTLDLDNKQTGFFFINEQEKDNHGHFYTQYDPERVNCYLAIDKNKIVTELTRHLLKNS